MTDIDPLSTSEGHKRVGVASGGWADGSKADYLSLDTGDDDRLNARLASSHGVVKRGLQCWPTSSVG